MKLLCVIIAFLCACSGDSQPKNNTNNQNNSNNVNNSNNLNNTNNANNGCNGTAPECAPGCEGDLFGGSACVNGRWQCEDEGWVIVDDCPAGSCFGLPTPGDVCDDGFQCRPNETGALDSCDELMCGSCRGFDPATGSSSRCNCRCADNGSVQCFTCEVTSTTNLGEVTIDLVGDPCYLFLNDLDAEPIVLAYDITVPDPIVVTPTPQDAGGCGQPNDSGLITFERISSATDDYCLCDTGLCAPNEEQVELVAGTHRVTFEWGGRNWNGPSDTNNPIGELFQAGEATVVVSATGRDENDQDFEVRSELTIRLD